MERVSAELEALVHHWDERGIAPLVDHTGHDSRQDEHHKSPLDDRSRKY